MGCGAAVEKISGGDKINADITQGGAVQAVQQVKQHVQPQPKAEPKAEPSNEPDIITNPIVAECKFDGGTLKLNEHYVMWFAPDGRLVQKVPLYAVKNIKAGGMFSAGSLRFDIMTDSETGKHTNKWMQQRMVNKEYKGECRDHAAYKKALYKVPDGGDHEAWFLDDSKVKPEWFFIKQQSFEIDGCTKSECAVFARLLHRLAVIQRDYEGANPYYITVSGTHINNAMLIWDYDTPDARGSLYATPAEQYMPASPSAMRRGYHNAVILKEGYRPLYIRKIKLDEKGRVYDILGKMKRGEMPAGFAAKLETMRRHMPAAPAGSESAPGVDSDQFSVVAVSDGLDILTPDRRFFIAHMPYYRTWCASMTDSKRKTLTVRWMSGCAGAYVRVLMGTDGCPTIQNHGGPAAAHALNSRWPEGTHNGLEMTGFHERIFQGHPSYKAIYGDYPGGSLKRYHPGHVLYKEPAIQEPSAASDGGSTSGRDRTISEQDIRENFARFSPLEFEHVIADLFRARGYEIEGDVGVGNDRGIDVLAKSGGKRVVIQVKKYRGNVGGPDINKTLGAMAATEADSCMVITTGGFTEQALSIAGQAANIEIWDAAQTRREFEITYMGASAA